MSDSAANWAAGQGLTWSGKWHVIENRYPGKSFARALCGVLAYDSQGFVPKYVSRLQSIAKGFRTAPICKKCERSKRAKEAALS